MIPGKPTLQTVVDLIEDEGCPRCGELPGWIDITAPGELFIIADQWGAGIENHKHVG